MAFPSGLVQFWECLKWDCKLRTEVYNLPLCPGASYDQAEAHPQRCSVLCPECRGCVPRLPCAEGIVTGSLENWWQSTFLSPNNSCYLWQLLSSKQSNPFTWVVSDKLSWASQASSLDRCEFLLALVSATQGDPFRALIRHYISPYQPFRRVQKCSHPVWQCERVRALWEQDHMSLDRWAGTWCW